MKKQLEDIKKLFKNWQFRHLTPYREITIIKTLALSKLTHIVCVLPSINVRMIRQINQLCFNFIWDGKPDKISRKATIMPEALGGLGMKCVETFWTSIQCSWFRRIRDGNAFWLKVLKTSLYDIGEDLDTMWNWGVNKFHKIANQIDNPF